MKPVCIYEKVQISDDFAKHFLYFLVVVSNFNFCTVVKDMIPISCSEKFVCTALQKAKTENIRLWSKKRYINLEDGNQEDKRLISF